MQLGQERRLPRQGQHPLLHHRALHIVILDHDVLLQDLHSIELVRAFSLREHDLGKRGSLSGWLEGPGAGGGGEPCSLKSTPYSAQMPSVDTRSMDDVVHGPHTLTG